MTNPLIRLAATEARQKVYDLCDQHNRLQHWFWRENKAYRPHIVFMALMVVIGALVRSVVTELAYLEAHPTLLLPLPALVPVVYSSWSALAEQLQNRSYLRECKKELKKAKGEFESAYQNCVYALVRAVQQNEEVDPKLLQEIARGRDV